MPTNNLTPSSTVLLDKLIVPQIREIFFKFCGNPRFITIARHLSLSSAKWTQEPNETSPWPPNLFLTNLNVQRYIAASCLPQIAMFFPCFHFSLPLTSPPRLYVLFSSTCISVKTCNKIGYRNKFITHSCTLCIHSCAISLFKKKSAHFQGSRSPRSFKMVTIGCPKTSTNNYQQTPRIIPREQRYRFQMS